VNGFIAEMMRAGILQIDGTGHVSGRGRKTAFINLSSSYGACVGIHIQDEWLQAVSCDSRGAVMNAKRFSMKSVTNGDRLIDAIARAFDQMCDARRHPGRRLGLGLAVPGSVGEERTTGLYYSHFPWWRNIPFKKALTERLEVPVSLDNDVRAEASAEMWFGHGQDIPNFIFFDIGHGAAMTLVVNGSLYRGGGLASEWGHSTIDRNGPRCSCGNVGCLDEFLSDRYLRQRLLDACPPDDGALRRRVSLRPIQELLKSSWERHDEIRQRVLDEVVELIGIGVVNLVNTFNPSLIVLGGILSELREAGLLEGVWTVLKERAFGSLTSYLDIRVTSQDDATRAAHGAAGFVLERFFGDIAKPGGSVLRRSAKILPNARQ